MTFKLTWYGHATFGMDIDGTQVLLDPFFSGNPVVAGRADGVALPPGTLEVEVDMSSQRRNYVYLD